MNWLFIIGMVVHGFKSRLNLGVDSVALRCYTVYIIRN